jgi:hypothetical protein
LDLCGDIDAVALIKLFEGSERPPVLIVIDTLALSIGAGDENSGSDMGSLIASASEIRSKTGAHVMVVHHSGKDASRGARGHSNLRGASDTEIEIKGVGEVRTATAHKQRDMERGKKFSYCLRVIDLDTDQDGDSITSCVVEAAGIPDERGLAVSKQQSTALSALDEAIAAHGVAFAVNGFPSDKTWVTVAQWRDACGRHPMTDGTSESSARQAFGRAAAGLKKRGVVVEMAGLVSRGNLP